MEAFGFKRGVIFMIFLVAFSKFSQTVSDIGNLYESRVKDKELAPRKLRK